MQYVNRKAVPSDTLENRESLHNENDCSSHHLGMGLGVVGADEENNIRSLRTSSKFFIPFTISDTLVMKGVTSLRDSKGKLNLITSLVKSTFCNLSAHKTNKLNSGNQQRSNLENNKIKISTCLLNQRTHNSALVSYRDLGKVARSWLHTLNVRSLFAPEF